MKQVESAQVIDTGFKKYSHKIKFSDRINRILRKYCHYRTFVFYYKSERLANEDLAKIISEIRSKYTGRLILIF